MGQTWPLFVYFVLICIYGVLGTLTRGGRMVGADESTELWRHPEGVIFMLRVKALDNRSQCFCQDAELFSNLSTNIEL